MAYRAVNIDLPVGKIQQEAGSSGCAVASSAMVVNYLKGTNMTYNDALARNGDVEMYWSRFADKSGVSFEKIGDSSFEGLKHELFSLLYNERIPVVVRVTGTTKNPTNYVVVNGFDGNLPFIEDSNGNEYPRLVSVTPSMFKIVDPEPAYQNNITLQDVMNVKKGDLKALYVYRRQ